MRPVRRVWSRCPDRYVPPQVPRHLSDVARFVAYGTGPLPLAWCVALAEERLARWWTDEVHPATLVDFLWHVDRRAALVAVRAVVDDLAPCLAPRAAARWHALRDRYDAPSPADQRAMEAARAALIADPSDDARADTAALAVRFAFSVHLAQIVDGEEARAVVDLAAAVHAGAPPVRCLADLRRDGRTAVLRPGWPRVAAVVRAVVAAPTLATLIAAAAGRRR